MVIGEVCYFLT